MKTLITASALILVSNVALSASYEQWQQNPDLGTGVYDKPVTLTEPMRGSSDYSVSLDDFNRGNADYSPHAKGEVVRSGSDEGFASSLDSFNEGNPDHV